MATRGDSAVLVQLQGKIIGPVPVKDLYRLSGFNVNTFVSFPGSEKWAPAFRVLNLRPDDPPLAITSDADFPPFFQPDSWAITALSAATRRSRVRIIQGKIAPDRWFSGSWTDRWFRRVVTLNLLLVLVGWAAWSYPPVRVFLQRELQTQLSETPKPAPLQIAQLNLPISQPRPVKRHAKPIGGRTRRREIVKSKPNSKSRPIKLAKL